VELLQAHDNAGSFLDKPAMPDAATGAYTPNPSSDASAPSTPTEQAGSCIGPYKLLQLLGEGGMGSVYMAEQEQPVRRRVALKIIKAGMDSAQVIARFEQERQALAMMDHPNIAKVLDAGTTTDGRPFFAMELVKGIPITKYCDQEHLSPQERLELFIPVCHAVQHAHQKGIIHRDLKPSNVLIALYDGKPIPKVIDFGIAKATSQKLTERTMFTEVGSVIGTLEYMAPEQAELNNLDIDTRSDIYSLGVLLYELLTGSPPFTAKQLRSVAFTEMLRIIREVEPAKPSSRLSGSGELPNIAAQRKLEPKRLTRLILGDLDWIAMKCLEKDRSRRYESASGLAADIERYLKSEPVVAGPPSLAYRVRKFLRRNKGPVAAMAVVMLTLLLGAVISVWQAIRAMSAEEAAVRQSVEAQHARDAEKNRAGELADALIDVQAARLLEKETRQKAEQALANSTMMLARSRFVEGSPALAHELLERVAPEYRDPCWGLLNNHFAGGIFCVGGDSLTMFSVSFSPGGQRVASASGDTINNLRLWDARTGQQVRIFQGHRQAAVYGVAFSPSGHLLASASSDRTLRLWDAGSGQELHVLKGHTADVVSVCFSPDREVLASASRDKTVRLWDTRSGQELRVLKGHTADVVSVCFSPDGEVLASASWDKTVRLWDAASGQELRIIKGDTGRFHSICFSPNGQVLASASADKSVRLWDTKAGTVLRALHGHSDDVLSVCFSPDSQLIASASWDKTVRLWDARSGQAQRVLKGHGGAVVSVCFSPDGKALISAGAGGGKRGVFTIGRDNTLIPAIQGPPMRLWLVRSSEELRVLRANNDPVAGVCFSQNGKVLVSGSHDKTVRLWDVRSGSQLRVLKGHSFPIQSVSLSPDAGTLASVSDRGVWLWDANSGKKLGFLEGPGGRVSSVSFSPDGQLLASTGSNGTAWLWRATDGQKLHVFRGFSTYCVAFSPDSQVLAAAGDDGSLRLFNTKTGQGIREFKGHSLEVSSVSFSVDGEVLASAGEDTTVRLWNLKSGEPLHVLTGHALGVKGINFSPNGHVLASASADKTVRLWDARSGQELRVLKGHTAAVLSVRFSPDGQILASAGADGTIRLWDVRGTWVDPNQPLPATELAFRRWVTAPVPDWHVEKRLEAEKDNNPFAAAFHRSWEQHARGVLAFEGGDFQRAFAHFIAAAALKPNVAG
jgi:WD40 repeat protein/serine/threonine protein kinase